MPQLAPLEAKKQRLHQALERFADAPMPELVEKRLAPTDGGDSPSRGTPLRRARVQHILRVCAVELGDTEDEDPAEYVEESLEDDDIDELLQNAEDVQADENHEDELTMAAKERELEKLEEFGVFEVVPEEQSYGKKRVTTRWEIVHRLDGVRARFVAREFRRSEYMDDVFAPSSGHSTSRIVDFVALKKRQHTFTGDITNAFFHVPEDEECYVDPPREWLARRRRLGLSVKVMWRLLRQLYGRRRAGTRWVDFFAALLCDHCNMCRCEVAPQFFMDYDRDIFIEVHMDDFHGSGSERAIADLKKDLEGTVQFKVWEVHGAGAKYEHLKRLRTLSEGMTEIECNPKYLQSVLQLAGLVGCKPAPTPSVAGHLKVGDEVSEELDAMQTKTYRMIVGTLQYMVVDRVDVQFEVNVLARQMKHPTLKSWAQLKRLVRYLAGTTGARIVMLRPESDDPDMVSVTVWSDSDWAGDQQTRQSQSSLHVEADGCPLFSTSRRQMAISHSSGEAEYYAGVSAAAEGLFIKQVLEHAGFGVKLVLLMDSAAARGICRREGVGKIRHLSAKTLWLQKAVKSGWITVDAVTSEENKADLGTKSLGVKTLRRLRRSCGLAVPEAESDDEQYDEEQVSMVSASGGGARGKAMLQAVIGLLAAFRGEAREAHLTRYGDLEAPTGDGSSWGWIIFGIILLLIYTAGIVVCTVRLVSMLVKQGWQGGAAQPPPPVAQQRRASRRRDMATQSQATHTYISSQGRVAPTNFRFVPLNEREQGAWIIN